MSLPRDGGVLNEVAATLAGVRGAAGTRPPSPDSNRLAPGRA